MGVFFFFGSPGSASQSQHVERGFGGRAAQRESMCPIVVCARDRGVWACAVRGVDGIPSAAMAICKITIKRQRQERAMADDRQCRATRPCQNVAARKPNRTGLR
jgi:hypothetical protein